ncbi:MAG: DUF5696 domain-containing protein [Candidatus Limiplasma sp.]|jgi:hypothetical protein|nr:DUF5696 domain-containing protein [Candidatus Limiplasma sp.]
MMKKFLILLLLCLLPVMAFAEVILVAENDRLELHYDTVESQIILKDKLTQEEWRSTPDDIAQDKRATGVNKINRQSDLIVQYHNTSYVTDQVNSYTGAIKKGDFTWELIENGVAIRYYFPKQGFVIPVQYVLEEDCLAASIISEGIEEEVWEDPDTDPEKKQSVMNVALLPFMGAAGSDDEGYLIIPDGSGALIHFNNGRTGAAIYQQDVYGRDDALTIRKAATTTYDVNMPLFGIVRNGRALMAVVENGDYQAQLNAMVNGQLTGYSNAYFAVQYIHMEANTIMPGSEHSTDVMLPTNTFRDMGNFTVRYYPLAAENATYADVAAAYRAQLGLKESIADAATQQLEMVASIPSIDTFLGVPYESVRVLTSYEQAAQTLRDFAAEGLNDLTLRYTGWSKQSVRGKMVTGLDLDNRLGGKKAFDGLRQAVKETGAEMVLAVDLIDIYEDGNGYWSLFAATDSVNSTAKQVPEFLQSTGYQDPEGKPWYLLSPDKVPEAARKLAENLSGQVDGVSLSMLGNTVYSSFGKTGISRTSAGMYWQQALETLSGKIQTLSAKTASAYAFPYIEQVDATPCASSRFEVTDMEIPFYQMVTHGAMVLYTEPANEDGNVRKALLRAIEYGMYPSWRVIAGDTALLSGTDYASWHAASLDAWREEIKNTAAWMAPLGVYAGMQMTGHEQVTATLSVTTYANGDMVLVNYGSEDAEHLGVTVPALGYAIKEVSE